MSVGGRDPKTQGTPPVPVARSRVDTRPMHKVSFKLTKPKPSKIKYLTQSEIIGICISILISFGISIIVVSIGINVVPVILRKTVEIVKELADIAKGNMDRAVQKPPTYSRYLTVHSDLNCNTFSSEYEDKDPVLFETTSWVKIPESGVETTCGSVLESHTIDLRPFEVFADMAPDIENAPGMEMTVNQFMKGEFTLNSDMENGNHWAFTTNRNALPQQLLPAGLKLPLSLSTAAHESDTCATHSHPLADFVPVSLAWARNTSELSGGPFHAHTRSVSLLLQGRKRWVLFPPGQVCVQCCAVWCNVALLSVKCVVQYVCKVP